LWLGLRVVPCLPRRLVLGLARWAGGVGFRLARRDRRIALANLDLAYGVALSSADKQRIVRESFVTFATTMLDGLWFSRRTAQRTARWVAFDESTAGLWPQGPLVLVTAHFGNWEIMGLAGTARGYALASVAKPIRNPLVDRMLARLRTRTGQQIVPVRGAAKELLRVLKAKGKVALVLDQDTRPEEGGVFVEFFGVPAPMSSAAAHLALRVRAPIVPIFCRMRPDGTYVCYARQPLGGDEPAEADPLRLTQAIARTFEAEIRSDPGQWLWMYKRWKRRAPGADPARYPFYADG
jgi:KDO2-lipid IV(A) lauroyltransferase